MKKIVKMLLVAGVISVLSWDVTCFAKVYFSNESAQRHLGTSSSTRKSSPAQTQTGQISWPETLEKFAGLGAWELKESEKDSATYVYSKGAWMESVGAVMIDEETHPGATKDVIMKISFAPNAVKNAKNYRGQLVGKCASGTKFHYETNVKTFDSRAEFSKTFLGIGEEENVYYVKTNGYKAKVRTVILFRPAKYQADVKVGFVHPEGVELVYKICQGIDPLLERILTPNKTRDEIWGSLKK